MTGDLLRLTVRAGERQRIGRGFLADALLDAALRHGVRSAISLRGSEGYGPRQHVRTDRLLTLSEDLPLVVTAVDVPERIEALHAEIDGLRVHGLVTLERLSDAAIAAAGPSTGDVRLSVAVGRRARAGSRPAHETLVARLRDHGLDGATVLLGVDGIRDGRRRRARFRDANADVPTLVVAVGSAEAITTVVPQVRALLDDPLLTLEPVVVCKRDGRTVDAPALGIAARADGASSR